MRACTALIATGLILGWAGVAAGQEAASPQATVEVGIGTARLVEEYRGRLAISPSVIVNLSARDALEVNFDRDNGPRASFYTDSAHVDYRRVVHRFDRGTVAATAGLVFVTRYRHLEYIDALGAGQPRIESAWRDEYLAATTGAEVDWRVAPHLTLRTGVQLGLSDRAGLLRVSAGVTVPLGRVARVPAREARPRSAQPWPSMTSGQTLWVTDGDGHETKGELIAVSATEVSLKHRRVVEQIPLSRVQRIDTTDHVRDGALRGFLIGGAAGGVLAILACDCEDYAALFALAGVGIGGGAGAAIGVLGDGLIDHRRPVYGASPSGRRITVLPMVTGKRAGIGGVLRW